MICHLFVDPVPLKLFGEGNYAVTDIQEVNVSEQFLDLDAATRGCTRNSELEGCETRTYLEKFLDEFAGCELEDLVKHGLRALRDTLPNEVELNKEVPK